MDASAMARVHVAAWRAAYRDFIAAEYLNSPAFEGDIRHHLDRALATPPPGAQIYVAAVADDLVAYCAVGPDPDDARVGAIYDLFVIPELWRRGIGRRLVERAVADLRQEGFTSLTLWIFDGNQQARDFYGKLGWVPTGITGVGGPAGDTPTSKLRRTLRAG